MADEQAYQNTDRELWREREDDYYANSIFVTESGGIGINVGGYVIVKPLTEWHKDASDKLTAALQHQEPGGRSADQIEADWERSRQEWAEDGNPATPPEPSALDRAVEALETAESWIDRHAPHVGNCRGGNACSCGRTLVLAEINAAALSAIRGNGGGT